MLENTIGVGYFTFLPLQWASQKIQPLRDTL